MLICRRFEKHEYLWNRFVVIVIILISNVNATAAYRMNLMHTESAWSNYESDCNTYGTCAKCATKASTCRWLLKEQTCVGLSSVVNTVKSCPTFRAAAEAPEDGNGGGGGGGGGSKTCAQCVTESPRNSWIMENGTCMDSSLVVGATESCPRFDVGVGHSSLHVTIANRVQSFDEVLSNGIHCDVDGRRVNATRTDGNQYTCDLTASAAGWADRLCVNYLSLAVDGGARLKFDDPRDHYFTSFDRRCPVRCVTGFWETESDVYYCKWCLKKDECALSEECAVAWPCHVRRVRNATAAPHDPMATIDVLSPEIKIVSVSPSAAASSAGPATVDITVRHHLFLADQRRVQITAAGRPCRVVELRTRMSNETTIRCTVTPAGARYENRGPVVITYGGRRPAFRLTSAADAFRFVTPVVHGLAGPRCGPVMGGTLLHIRGAHLNATGDARVLMDGNRTCPIVARDCGRITCAVGAAREPGSSRVRVTFDGRPPLRVGSSLSYEYVADPAIDDGQTFESIASGGTTQLVRGRFSCIEEWRMYVVYRGARRLGEPCAYLDNRTIMCTTPRTRGPGDSNDDDDDDDGAAVSLPHGFVSSVGGRALDLTATNTNYVVHPDPVFDDFEIDENTLRINGRHLNPGYIKADLAVRIQGSSDTLMILNVEPEAVECWVLSALDVPAIVVDIGGCQQQVVQIKFNPGKFILSSMTGVFGGFVVLTVCVAFASVLMFVLQTTVDSSNLRTEKRYVKLLRDIGARISGER